MIDAILESSKRMRQDSVIKPTKLAHIVIRTKNVARLVDWYTKVFHAEAAFNNGGLAFLTFDDEHHRFAIGALPDLEEPNHKAAGFDHVAFSYGSIGELLETYGRLKSLGIEPYWNIDHGVTTSLYYNDPDGNQVELQVDNFNSRDEAFRYFQSPAFAENPVGVEFDADALLKRYMSGEDSASLLAPGTKNSN
jgi:catechol-2,3-dioxygenase